MKCLLFIFSVFTLGRLIDGQNIMEGGPEKRDTDEDSRELFQIEDMRGEDPEEESKEQEIETVAKNDERKKKQFQDTIKRFASEMAAGDTADLVGQNPHVQQEDMYMDLGRRFVPQYKYTGAFKNIAAEHQEELIPEKAPPELVLVVAKESALLGPDKEDLGNDVDRKKILRSGDYWNGVWKEDVNIKRSGLRSGSQKKVLGSIKAKIKPGSEFYRVVSRMKKISPRLLYIINKNQL